MKYQKRFLSSTKVLIHLIPETKVESDLLITLDKANPDHEFTIHHYYQEGLSKHNPSAVLLKVDFHEFPIIAECSFEVVIGLG